MTKNSMLVFDAEQDFDEEAIERLRKYVDNRTLPTEVVQIIGTATRAAEKYAVIKVAKQIEEYQVQYSMKGEEIHAEELPVKKWHTHIIYLHEDKRSMYVSGANAIWAGKLISKVAFQNEEKIQPKPIDVKKIEQDIRSSAKFEPVGTAFVDGDGTKITLHNPGGLNLSAHYVTADKAAVDKTHIDIIIEKDGKRLPVKVYPSGKVTWYAYFKNPTEPLMMFLRLWEDLLEYC